MRKVITSILMGALFVFFNPVNGQNSKSSADKSTTTNKTEDDSVQVRLYDLNHARTATIASAIIPGLGQAYNKKYWKIPVIYGTGFIFYYFWDYNNYYYQRCLVALNLPKGETSNDTQLAGMDKGTIESYRDNFRRNRDFMLIFMGLLYTANVVDALVDSYMAEYDISKDLSLKVSPTIMQPSPDIYSASLGLKVGLRF